MLLAIETATSACSVALFDGDRLIASSHEIVGRGHAERLIPMIAELPDGGRADKILVGCGPGSFTGLRVGIAAARGLALAWGAELAGFSTLSLIAAGGGFGSGPVGVAIEGGHGELFCAAYQLPEWTALLPVASLLPDRAGELLPDIIIGNAAEQVIAVRHRGAAHVGDVHATNVLSLPPHLRGLSATPIYGRVPDAKANAAALG